jgi:hypothetical protein
MEFSEQGTDLFQIDDWRDTIGETIVARLTHVC